jgi:hypothetical protein
MSTHFKTICSVINKFPPEVDFEVSELGMSRLSQGLEGHTISLINQVNQAMFPDETSPQTLPYLKISIGEYFKSHSTRLVK